MAGLELSMLGKATGLAEGLPHAERRLRHGPGRGRATAAGPRVRSNSPQLLPCFSWAAGSRSFSRETAGAAAMRLV